MARWNKNDPAQTSMTLPAWTRSVRGWRIVGILVLILLATQLRYSERRAVHECAKAIEKLAIAENQLATERERFRTELSAQTQARQAAETERDQLKAALRLTAPQSGESPPPSPSDAPAADGASPRYPGIARADFARVLPHLIAVLKPAEANGSKGLRIDEALPVEFQRIGIQKADIITNIDRIPVAEVAPFADVLASYKTEAGFALRLIRGNDSMWLRVNILDAPTAPPAEVSPQRESEEAPVQQDTEEAPPS